MPKRIKSSISNHASAISIFFIALLVIICPIASAVGTGYKNIDARTATPRPDLVATMGVQIATLEAQGQWNNLFRLRQESWQFGGYAAILYSTPGTNWVRFEGDVDFTKSYSQLDYICSACKIGDHKFITLYDLDGKMLDRIEFASHLKPGDLVLAWHTPVYNGGPEISSLFYGKPWVKPLVWHEKTGLALGIFRIDGTIAVE